MGLAGMAAALLGPASVTMTDTAEMLPLMRRNIEKNFGEDARPLFPFLIAFVTDAKPNMESHVPQ